METQIIQDIWEKIYNSLDIPYIFTFIVICYAMNTKHVRNQIIKRTNLKARTRYRVAIVGILYGVLVFFLRGQKKEHIEILFQSFVTAIVFHKLIIDALVSYLINKGWLPRASQEQDKKEEGNYRENGTI